MNARLLATLLLASGVALPRVTAAQVPRTSDTLSLETVIANTLERATTVLLAQRQLEVARGSALATAAPYDAQLQTTVGRLRAGNPAGGANNGQPQPAVVTNQTSYTVAVSKLLRSGVQIVPQVDVTRTDVSVAPGVATALASAAVNAVVPLWKDRLGDVTRASEQAAQRQVTASEQDQRQAVADAVLASSTAYWRYVAAVRREEVQRAAEQRADRLVSETQTLVKADERAPADLTQLRANSAAKRAARIAAEQATLDAWRQLLVAMGLDGAQAVPASISTDFPDAAAYETWRGPVDSLVALGVRMRDDRGASTVREGALESLVRATEHDLAPRLDLSVGVGYSGAERGWGVGRFFTPLGRNQSGLNTTLQLNYLWSLGNVAARGRAVSQLAAYQEQRLATADLERRISAGVASALDALRLGASTLVAAHDAVALSRETVENQRTKFQLGDATLIDVLTAEDALTNARLSEIAAQLSYASAIASLRRETGTLLVPARDAAPRVDARTLLTLP